jgi:hypothetical protein
MATLGDWRGTELRAPKWSWPTAELLQLPAELFQVMLEVLGPFGVTVISGALLVIAVEAVRCWLGL